MPRGGRKAVQPCEERLLECTITRCCGELPQLLCARASLHNPSTKRSGTRDSPKPSQRCADSKTLIYMDTGNLPIEALRCTRGIRGTRAFRPGAWEGGAAFTSRCALGQC